MAQSVRELRRYREKRVLFVLFRTKDTFGIPEADWRSQKVLARISCYVAAA